MQYCQRVTFAVIVTTALSYSSISMAATGTLSSSQMANAGYSVGYMLGSNIKQSAPDLPKADIIKGVNDALDGKATLTPEQMEKLITAYQKQREEIIHVNGIKNLTEGTAFLARNGKKAAVKTTASGLQYEVLRQGNGRKPNATDKVTVQYEGKTLDGNVFDSTEKNGGEPAEFPLDQLIPGWTEGVQLMPVGSKYRFYIPSNLAYGEQGAPQGGIPPNSVLIFDIDLLNVT